MFAVLHKPIEMDPFFSGAFRTIKGVNRILNRNEALKTRLTKVLKARERYITDLGEIKQDNFVEHFITLLAHMQISISPELILTHPIRSPISLTTPTSKWFNERVNNYSCCAFIDHLHVRCNGAGRKGDRKDVSDIPADIDIYAANALRNKIKVEWAKGPMTEYSELVNYDLSSVELKILDSIIAGSICAKD